MINRDDAPLDLPDSASREKRLSKHHTPKGRGGAKGRWEAHRSNGPMKLFPLLVLVFISIACAGKKSPVACGFAVGTGIPWIIHFKPELILRIVPKKPSFSVFAELNSVILVSEYSLGISVNFESRGGYMNSIYLGSGDAESAGWGEESPTVAKEYMAGWELKKEYGYNFGYFLNCGLEHLDGGKTFPKANIGFFVLPGF